MQSAFRRTESSSRQTQIQSFFKLLAKFSSSINPAYHEEEKTEAYLLCLIRPRDLEPLSFLQITEINFVFGSRPSAWLQPPHKAACSGRKTAAAEACLHEKDTFPRHNIRGLSQYAGYSTLGRRGGRGGQQDRRLASHRGQAAARAEGDIGRLP